MFGIDQLHPIFVHFPVAFLTLAAGTALWWVLTGGSVARQMTALLLTAGFLGAVAAYYTGDDMADAFASRPAVKLLVERHADFALYTLIASAVAAAAFISACLAQRSAERKGFDGPNRRLSVRLLCAALALLTAALVGYTGHLGGLMTWSTELNRPAAAAPAAATGR
jgi:uncharacterized membrane protein